MKQIKAGVLGCTGIVGQQFVRLLDGHPDFKLCVLTASARSAGKAYGQAQTWVVGGDVPESCRNFAVVDTDITTVLESGARVIFSALPAQTAGPLETALREKGAFVFSNASAHRTDHDVPILVPEANHEHLQLAERQASRHGGFIIAGPNCSAAGLVMTLKPLDPFGIKAVSVTTFQSISGAGRRGQAALDIAGNVVPFIRNEEEKIRQETKKILGVVNDEGNRDHPLDVRASCCRVPVRDGHLLSIEVEFDHEPDQTAVLKAIGDFRSAPQELKLHTAPDRPLILRMEEDRPQPALDLLAGNPERARGMAVVVGRPRFRGRFLSLFALVHNAVRGSAGTCLLNAELAVRKGLIL